jgi:hypothetical protein
MIIQGIDHPIERVSQLTDMGSFGYTTTLAWIDDLSPFNRERYSVNAKFHAALMGKGDVSGRKD